MSKTIYMHATLAYFDLKGVQVFPDHNDQIEQRENYTVITKKIEQ